ncbi:MAG: hypothetical protein II304_08045 [Bacteroidales bacterium]|nr:hypothetical protein [Bacteroidales bacterium]MEE1220485.1 hypothetical protein [Bacteroidales bacterium]
MKRILLLAIALFMCGVAVSQENEKKFTLSIQESLLPFGDITYFTDNFYHDIEVNYPNDIYLNYLPSFELDYDNKFSARLRFNVLKAEFQTLFISQKNILPGDDNEIIEFFDEITTSTSLVLGYNFLNKSKAHRLKASAILGAAYIYMKGEVSEPIRIRDPWHFQVGGELSYQYFLPSTNYRLGLGASCEFSYVNGLYSPHFLNFNLNVSYKLFNF